MQVDEELESLILKRQQVEAAVATPKLPTTSGIEMTPKAPAP